MQLTVDFTAVDSIGILFPLEGAADEQNGYWSTYWLREQRTIWAEDGETNTLFYLNWNGVNNL